MIIVGYALTPEEAEEITFVAKVFLVGNRIRMISRGELK